MFAIVGNDPRAGYPILLGLGELFGLSSIILVGLIFDKNIPPKNKYVYNWPDSPFGYHPLMMTLGLLFCYGNAILLYRTFTTTSKMLMKILHALLLILSLLFAAIGLAAIIRNKNINKAPHFMTYHSWLGLTTIILFVFQWICGFVCFLFPQLSLNIRKGYMPTHRLWGKIIFLSASIAVLTGLSEHGMTSSFSPANIAAGDTEQIRRLIMNFFAVFASLFTLIVIYLLSNPGYQRPPDPPPIEKKKKRRPSSRPPIEEKNNRRPPSRPSIEERYDDTAF